MKILLLTNHIKTIRVISNYVGIYYGTSVSILIAEENTFANQILKKYSIDLIILDFQNFSFELYNKNFPFIPLILITDFYNYNKNILETYENVSVDDTYNLEYLLNKYIHSFNSIENIKEEIMNQLTELGFNIKHNGTRYLMEAIIIHKYFCKTKSNVKDIYTIIAREYNTTSNNIKSNILKSIDYMYYETDFSKIKTYFSLVEDIKPTPKQVIFTLSKNI